MKVRSHLVLGSVGAAFIVVAAASAITGGRGVSRQGAVCAGSGTAAACSTGAVNRTIEEKSRESISVKDFGAVGDGSTNDATAIQTAINSLPTGATGGGLIFFPCGQYLIGTTGLTIPSGLATIRLLGAARDCVRINYTGSGTALTIGDSSTDTRNAAVEELLIDLTNSSGGANGIVATRLIGGRFFEAWIQGRIAAPDGGTGLLLQGTGNYTGNVVLDRTWVNGNWTIAVDNEGPGTNTCNHQTFRDGQVSRTITQPATGTIGFKWGANCGDGIILDTDVEGYDTGYEVDGAFLKGYVRAEFNTTGLNFGTASHDNEIHGSFYLNTSQIPTYTGGQVFNSFYDGISFQNTLSNSAGDGRLLLRQQFDQNVNLALQAGSSADQQARIEWWDRSGSIKWRAFKNIFNAFVLDDGAGAHTRIVLSGGSPDDFDLRGVGTGTILLNKSGGTGGTCFGDGAGNCKATVNSAGQIGLVSVLQANLGTPANGTIVYCSDCTTATACTGGGTGALASRQNGAWKCL